MPLDVTLDNNPLVGEMLIFLTCRDENVNHANHETEKHYLIYDDIL